MDGMELEPFDMHKSQTIAIASLFAISAVVCFSQCLKRDTYNSRVSPRCTLFATGSYEQCCTLLMKVLHKYCNMDMLGILLIYPHSTSGTARPWDCVYISVNLLLPCYNT